jgi:multiple sugar transport system permease protein
MVSTSLKQDIEVFRFPPNWIPEIPQWNNYVEAIQYIPFFRYTVNTLVICVLTVIGSVLSCSLVAYSLARIEWPGRDFLFMLTLAVLMIPFPVTMIPLFIVFSRLGWVSTFKPLIIPYFFGSPFYIFLLRQFLMTIPREISDAAYLDGASDFQIYSRLILPLTKPALATVALFQFMSSWHDFLGPLIYLNDERKYTLSLGLHQFQTAYGTEWQLLMAASTLMSIPIIILFFLAQRTFIQGITLTGIKE